MSMNRVLHGYGAGVPPPANGLIGMRVGSGCHGRTPTELAGC
jgi:hypothetical protein